MFNPEEKERYSRHFILEGFGEKSQRKLKEARVLVVGAGGLGCPALLYLSAAGVGRIGIADNDRVSLSNLQRQILFLSNDIGSNKAEKAKERLLQNNPHINITSISEKITKVNALAILKDYDLVIDGSDNFATRYLLNDACVILNKPLVYGAIHRYEGQVTVFNYNNGPTYRCLFPEPPPADEMPGCNEAGVLGVLPGIIGTWQATEALKIISGIGNVLSGKLLTFDLLSNVISAFEFTADKKNRQIDSLGEYEDALFCPVKELDVISFNELKLRQSIQLIDVRERYEYAQKNLNGINIPLSELDRRITEINPDLKTVIHCKTGVRSQKAIQKIRSRYPTIDIYNLSNPL